MERVSELAPKGVDVALDAAGEEALQASVELIHDKKRIGTLVAFDLSEKLGTIPIRSKRSVSRLSELTQMYEQGLLRVVISQTFPLHQATDAHKAVETGHVRGKIVLTVD